MTATISETPFRSGGLAWLRRAHFFATLIAALSVLLPARLVMLLVKANLPSRSGVYLLRALLWGLRVRVELRGELNPASLIVANHVSWTDVLVLGALQPAAFVAKAEVQSWPLLGLLARLHGTIFIDRDERRRARHQVAAVSAALLTGPVIVFPEGTTGSGGEVLPFRSTLFAGAAGHTVQPVTILYRPRGRDWSSEELSSFCWDGDKAFWPHLLQVSGGDQIDVVVIAHPPMICDGADRKVIAARCCTIVREGLLGHA